MSTLITQEEYLKPPVYNKNKSKFLLSNLIYDKKFWSSLIIITICGAIATIIIAYKKFKLLDSNSKVETPSKKDNKVHTSNKHNNKVEYPSKQNNKAEDSNKLNNNYGFLFDNFKVEIEFNNQDYKTAFSAQQIYDFIISFMACQQLESNKIFTTENALTLEKCSEKGFVSIIKNNLKQAYSTNLNYKKYFKKDHTWNIHDQLIYEINLMKFSQHVNLARDLITLDITNLKITNDIEKEAILKLVRENLIIQINNNEQIIMQKSFSNDLVTMLNKFVMYKAEPQPQLKLETKEDKAAYISYKNENTEKFSFVSLSKEIKNNNKEEILII